MPELIKPNRNSDLGDPCGYAAFVLGVFGELPGLLVYLRKKRKESQGVVAKAIGWKNFQKLSDWETGKVKASPLDELSQLLAYYGIKTFDELQAALDESKGLPRRIRNVEEEIAVAVNRATRDQQKTISVLTRRVQELQGDLELD